MKFLKKDMPTLKWIFRVIGSDRKWIFFMLLVRVLQGLEETLSVLALRNVIGTVSQGSLNSLLLALLGLTRICSDARIVPQSFVQVFPQLLGLLVQIASALWALYFMMPEVAYLIIPGGMFLILLSALFRAKLKFHNKQVQASDGIAHTFMQERLSSLTIVRAFTQEENTAEQANRQMDKWVRSRLRWNRWVTFYQFVMTGALRGGYFICVVLCGVQLLRGKIGYDTLIAVLMLASRAGTPMANLSNLAPQYFAMLASAERMMEIEEYPLDYTEELHDQETVCNYYTKHFSTMGIRHGDFAYVPQGNQLLSGTIREAITFGAPNLMEKEQDIWNALRVACAEGFVRELPDGLDNELGEGGTGLSEGQMQRIAIARVVFSERPILLLDESTSALDSETERQLLRNLRTMTDRTVILVTHRPAAVEICDVKIEFRSQQ